MDHIIELVPVPEVGPNCFVVVRDGEELGEIDTLADGQWEGDVTGGNGPPSKPYATRTEAVRYVIDPAGSRDAEYDPNVDYLAKCLTAGIPIERTDTGLKLG